MKNRNTWKKCITLAGIATFSFAALFSPACTLTAEAAAGTETVAPCSDVLEWRFKEENGKLYKRLYNTTACVWVTDWIYVGEL